MLDPSWLKHLESVEPSLDTKRILQEHEPSNRRPAFVSFSSVETCLDSYLGYEQSYLDYFLLRTDFQIRTQKEIPLLLVLPHNKLLVWTNMLRFWKLFSLARFWTRQLVILQPLKTVTTVPVRFRSALPFQSSRASKNALTWTGDPCIGCPISAGSIDGTQLWKTL